MGAQNHTVATGDNLDRLSEKCGFTNAFIKIKYPWAWQFFLAAGKIDGVNAVAKRMVGLGNSHRKGLPGFIATPISIGILFRLDFRAMVGNNNDGGFGMEFAPVIAFIFLIFLIGPV